MTTIKIANSTTGEEIEREMTSQELTQWKADKAEFAAKEQVAENAATAKEAAQAKLAALGLNTDELKALGL